MEMQQEAVIEVEGLKKSFGDNHVLNGMHFKLYKGENLVILGKSGVGKSVLIKCIIKLITPDEGHLRVLDKNIENIVEEDDMNALRRRVGFLFQGGALYDSMTVEENLKFPLRRMPKKPTHDEMDERVHQALKNVGLEKSINKMPVELSGGMKKRIALARTLILQPDIVLYDEPTTGLDPSTSKEISRLIIDMQQKFEISSIIITHDLSCARITANRMKIIKDGIFKYEGAFEELKNRKDPWLQDFFE
ncbi:MAG: ATP-binding cassette domain-containing protein [Fulvivirga sp.]